MKTERNRRVKGSVLFTVVSVMSLLIIFLMATLVLATSANKRAHKSYSTSQTQYTARTAVDSVFQAIGASQDFADSIGALSSTNKGPLNVTVELDNNASSMGRVDGVTVEWIDSQYFYDDTENKWEEKDLLRITAEVTLGGQTTTGSSYILKDPPLTSTTQGGGAGFVTAGGAQTSNHTSAFGGTYLNISKYVDETVAAPLDYETMVYNLQTKNYLTNDNFSLTNGQIIEADAVINGNLVAPEQCVLAFPAPGTGFTVWGDFSAVNGNSFRFISENVSNGMGLDYTEVPYFYVDDVMTFANNAEIGDASFPLNVFCGSMNITGGTNNISADIYCMDENVTSFITPTGTTALAEWSDSVINKTVSTSPISHNYGSIYSKGSLQLGGTVDAWGNKSNHGTVVIDGDVRVAQDLTIVAGSNDVEIKGNVVVGGTLRVINSSGKCIRLCSDPNTQLYAGAVDISGLDTSNNHVPFYVKNMKYGESTVNSQYIAVNNFFHEGYYTVNGGYTMKNNVPYFYEYKVENGKTMNGGNVTNGATVLYYRYRDGMTPDPNNKATINIDAPYEANHPDVVRGIYERVDSTGTKMNPVEYTNDKYSFFDMTGLRVADFEAAVYTPEWYTKADINGADTNIAVTEAITYYDTATGAEVSSALALNSAVEVPIINYRDAERNNSASIYPAEMERSVVIGITTMNGYRDDGTYGALTKDDTQIVKTVQDIVKSTIDPYRNTQYAVPSGYQAEVAANVYPAGTLGEDANGIGTTGTAANPIKTSCTITAGSISNRTVYIDPIDGTELWVKLEGNITLENGSKIIIKDKNKIASTKVNFILANGSKFELLGTQIITEKINDLLATPSTPLSVTNYSNIVPTLPAGTVELDPPQVYFYSEKNNSGTATIAEVYMGNGNSFITGNVKAPYLKFSIDTGMTITNPIYYNGLQVNGYNDGNLGNVTSNIKVANGSSTAPTDRIPIIGSLNVGEGSFQNNWVLLYVDPSKNNQPPISTPNHSNFYQTIYYEEY